MLVVTSIARLATPRFAPRLVLALLVAVTTLGAACGGDREDAMPPPPPSVVGSIDGPETTVPATSAPTSTAASVPAGSFGCTDAEADVGALTAGLAQELGPDVDTHDPVFLEVAGPLVQDLVDACGADWAAEVADRLEVPTDRVVRVLIDEFGGPGTDVGAPCDEAAMAEAAVQDVGRGPGAVTVVQDLCLDGWALVRDASGEGGDAPVLVRATGGRWVFVTEIPSRYCAEELLVMGAPARLLDRLILSC